MDPPVVVPPAETPEPRVTDSRDRVMWLFALIAGILLVLAVVTIAMLAIFRPEYDTGELAKAVSTQLSLIVGAVLGYAARGPSTVTSPPERSS